MNKRISQIFISLYFVIPFLPPLGEMVLDLNTLRLYYFSILNTIALTYIYFDDKLSKLLTESIKNKISIALGLFIIWGLISYTYAFNKVEVIVRLFAFINFYISFLIGYVFLRSAKPTFKEVSLFFSVILILQVSFSFYALETLTTLREYDFSMNSKIIGIFSNRNITSAIYLIQLPFLIYLFSEIKNKFFKAMLFIISILVVYIIFLLASRTAYVIILGLIIINLIILLISKQNINQFKNSFLANFTIIIIIGFIITYTMIGDQNNSNPVNRIQTIDFQEESTNTRLRYYSYGINDFIKNPLIGYGLGNFKIISIDRDKENINSYTIPYTMHNDFLEVAVELGIIGLLIFSFVFIFPIYLFYKQLKIGKPNTISVIILSSLMVYLIDANLNFPFTRMASLIYLAFIVNLMIYYYNQSLDENN